MFKVGDKVLVENTRKKGRKGVPLEDNFSGPYTIVKINKHSALLRGLKRRVALHRLKIFDDDDDDDDGKPKKSTDDDDDAKKKKSNDGDDEKDNRKKNADEKEKKNKTGDAYNSKENKNGQKRKNDHDETKDEKKKRKNSDPQESEAPQNLKFVPPTLEDLRIMIERLGMLNVQEKLPPFGEPKEFQAKTPPRDIVHVKADGNCLFRSFSVFLTSSEENHASVRRAITEFMLKDQSKIFSTLLGCPVADYLAKGVGTEATSESCGRKHWGTDIEISAFATVTRSRVVVFQDKWLRYPPLHHPNSRRTRKNIESGITCLLHHPPNHFNLVLRM